MHVFEWRKRSFIAVYLKLLAQISNRNDAIGKRFHFSLFRSRFGHWLRSRQSRSSIEDGQLGVFSSLHSNRAVNLLSARVPYWFATTLVVGGVSGLEPHQRQPGHRRVLSRHGNGSGGHLPLAVCLLGCSWWCMSRNSVWWAHNRSLSCHRRDWRAQVCTLHSTIYSLQPKNAPTTKTWRCNVVQSACTQIKLVTPSTSSLWLSPLSATPNQDQLGGLQTSGRGLNRLPESCVEPSQSRMYIINLCQYKFLLTLDLIFSMRRRAMAIQLRRMLILQVMSIYFKNRLFIRQRLMEVKVS